MSKMSYLSLLVRTSLITVLSLTMPLFLLCQTRYLDPVFSEVRIDTGLVYGSNATAQFLIPLQAYVQEDLRLDLYQPEEDTALLRPLVMYLHTGNFLPFRNPALPEEYGFNGSCGGERTDSSAVEICTVLARMGYVSASLDYRLGWNPLAPSDTIRRWGLLGAVYRGVQDVRTAIRFFRRSVTEGNNPYRIDTSRMVLWGEGAGGFVALAASSLDTWEKIPTATEGKFLWDNDQNPATPPVSMIDTLIYGDIYGTSVGIDPLSQDTVCYPNHSGYSSDFHLTVNLSGASLDTAWMDEGQPPILSFALPKDHLVPYGEDSYAIPPLNIVKTQGSYTIQHSAWELGLQTPFWEAGLAFALHPEQVQAFMASPPSFQSFAPGLYPFNVPEDPATPGLPWTTTPWAWTSPEVKSQLPHCPEDGFLARKYLDTILNFYAPRACWILGIQPCMEQLSHWSMVSPEEPFLQVYPNPASSRVFLESEPQHVILEVKIFNAAGQELRALPGNHSHLFVLERSGLASGEYHVQTRMNKGLVLRKIFFH